MLKREAFSESRRCFCLLSNVCVLLLFSVFDPNFLFFARFFGLSFWHIFFSSLFSPFQSLSLSVCLCLFFLFLLFLYFTPSCFQFYHLSPKTSDSDLSTAHAQQTESDSAEGSAREVENIKDKLKKGDSEKVKWPRRWMGITIVSTKTNTHENKQITDENEK